MKSILILFLLFSFSFASYGELLFNGNCFTCHKILTSKTAPSLRQIQKTYKNAFLNKQDFISYMSAWVLQPKEESSLMQESIRKYKLMPELGYQEEVLKDIASYIYESDFSKLRVIGR